MITNKHILLSGVLATAALAAPLARAAVETTGTPGSPGATTTIDGKQLPPPDPKFGGVIKDGALQIESLVGATRSPA